MLHNTDQHEITNDSHLLLFLFDYSRPNPGRTEEINLYFIFILVCGASKGFVKVCVVHLKGFMKAWVAHLKGFIKASVVHLKGFMKA